jgi:hypothetical protein
MAADFRAMLDDMMGPERNVDLDKCTGKTRQGGYWCCMDASVHCYTLSEHSR